MAFEEDESSFLKRYSNFFKFLAVLGVVALGLSFFYALTLFSPHAVDQEEGQAVFASENDPEMQALLAKSMELEEAFIKNKEASMVSDDAIAQLEEAISIQIEYLEKLGGQRPSARNRLRALETQLQDTLGERLATRSREIEDKAYRLRVDGNYDEALQLYREAFEMQQKVNSDYSLSASRNISRSATLKRTIAEMEAFPMFKELEETLSAARKAADDEDWQQAQQQYAKAVQLQEDININYRNTKFASSSQYEKIFSEMISLESSDLQLEIEEALTKAKEFEKAEEYQAAAEQYQIAQALQESLNRKYPKSLHAGRDKVMEYSSARNDMLSRELAYEILDQITLLDQLITDQKMAQASRLLTGLYRRAERFRENFSDSELISDDMLRKLQYLNAVRDSIAPIQSRILPDLIEVLDVENVYMSPIEVSQALFETIMGRNPSRGQVGESYPINSITWYEANEFCRRLGYVLGREVRLPTQGEFRSAVGRLRYVDIDAISWNLSNSNQGTHPVGSREANPLGFYDTLGNVSEWLWEEDSLADEVATMGGGSVANSLDELSQVPFVEFPKNERIATGGFRFVVIMIANE